MEQVQHADVEDKLIRLEDGRALAYREYGDPEGQPVFFFHGMPGSRVEARLGDSAAKAVGIRIIAPDRPGYGLSDFKRRRAFVDWSADLIELSRALNLGKFGVLGLSGGGAYAAVCAHQLPDRLTAAGIISGLGAVEERDTEDMGWLNRIGFRLAGRAPWLIGMPIRLMAAAARRFPDRALSLMMRSLPAPDRAVMDERHQMAGLFRDDVLEALRSGGRGWAWEALMYTRPWGFRLEEITMEVHLWHGEEDTNVPIQMARRQAAAIPNCRATYYSGEGHLFAVNRMDEILRVFCQ